MHFWGWIWPATLFGWCLFWNILSNSSTFSKIFFPGNGRPGWPTYSEKYTHLLIRCPNIYFAILPLVFKCLKQFSKLFQPFTIGLKQLLKPISAFCHWFSATVQHLSACFVHQFFKSVLLLLPLIFVCCFSRFLINLKTHFFVQKCTSGAGSDRLPFLDDVYSETYFLTVLPFLKYFFPEMVVQDDQPIAKSTHICWSGAPTYILQFYLWFSNV